MENESSIKFYKNKSVILAVIAVAIAALLYGLWAVVVDRPNQSKSKADSCAITDKLVNPCRPWLAVAPGKYTVDTAGKPVASDTLSQLANHEKRIGKQVDAVKTYHIAGQTLDATDKAIIERPDTFLMLNWKPVNSPWSSYASQMASVDAMAASIKTESAHKIFLTLWHEPENDISSGTSCTSLVGGAGSPTDFINMWRAVYNRFKADGVTNVVWAIDYMNYPKWDCVVDKLYPGDQYVDWIVFNAYGGNDGISFTDNVKRFYDMLSSHSCNDPATSYKCGGTVAHNYISKAWGIAEWSTRQTNEPQGITYINDAQRMVETNPSPFPLLKSYMIFDNMGPDGNENRVMYNADGTTSLKKAAAYTAFANSKVFSVGLTPDTTPPTVSVAAPPSGTSLKSVATLSATAADNIGVASTQFYVDDTLVGTDATASDGWSIKWDSATVPNSTHTVKAIASDAAGNTASATSDVVTSNILPPAIGSFTASPEAVIKSNATTLSWSVQGADSCSVTPAGVTNTTTTSWTTPKLTVATTYTLTCVHAGLTSTAKVSVAIVPPPAITSFTATPATVTVGNASTLAWATTNTTTCSVTPGGATDITAKQWQTLAFTAVGTSAYTLTCKSAAGVTTTATTNVVVKEAPKAPTDVVLTASSTSVVSGGKVTLAWSSTGSTSCTLSPVGLTVTGTSSSVTRVLSATTTYQVACKNAVGTTKSSSVTVTVTAAPVTKAPSILSFYASPANITSGQPSKLIWMASNVSSTGCKLAVSPLSSTSGNGTWTTPKLTITTTYTLTCTNTSGKASAQATVTVGAVAGRHTIFLAGGARPAVITLASFHGPVTQTAVLASTATPHLVASTGELVVDGRSVQNVTLGSLVTLDAGTINDAEEVAQIARVEYYDGAKLATTVSKAPFALNTAALKTGGLHRVTQRTYFTDGSDAEVTQVLTVGAATAASSKSSSWTVLAACIALAVVSAAAVLAALKLRARPTPPATPVVPAPPVVL